MSGFSFQRVKTLRICVFVALSVAGLSNLIAQPPGAPPELPAPVQVEEVLEQNVPPTREFVATVNPSKRSLIGSAVDGRVDKFHADAGLPVEKGQALAELLQETIRIEIRGAKAELDLRKAELEELREGARPEEIAQAEAQLAASTALEQYAKTRLARIRELSKSGGAISAEELDLAVSQFRSAEQRRVEFEESLRLMRAGTRKEQIAQAEARLEVQQEHVNLLEDRERKYIMRAPFDGYVVREYTEVGAWIKQGDPVAEVISINPVEIEVNVPESIIRFLHVGDTIPVRVVSIGGERLEGRLVAIVPEADIRARTFPVRISVENEPASDAMLIRPGMLAQVILPTAEALTGLTVPKDAAVFVGGGTSVYKVVDSAAVPVSIQIVSELEDRFMVTGDLQKGDKVVTRGNERLRPGQVVKFPGSEKAE